MKKFLQQTALAAGLMAVGFGVHAQTITLKVHHFLGPQSIQHTTMLGDWCKNIAKDSNNRLQCQIFPAMQLGGTPPQLYDQAKDGVADVVWTVAGYSAGRFAKTQVFELPFTMTNAAATNRAAWDFVQKHAMDEHKDVKLLAVHVHGPGVIFTRDKPITKMEDFKGMKMRAPTANVTKMLAKMGATPVGMPVPAVSEALSKGVIQGTTIPWEVGPALKVHELVKNHTTFYGPNGLYNSTFAVSMNKGSYDKLPADLKQVIDKNSGLETAAFFGRAMDEGDKVGRAIAQKAGNNIVALDAAETQRWRRTASVVADDWVKEVGTKGIDGNKLLSDARELIAKHSK